MEREPHFVVKYSSYLGTAIKLVLYILEQLFASVSVNSGGYLPRRSGSVNIHRYLPPLLRIIVKYCTVYYGHQIALQYVNCDIEQPTCYDNSYENKVVTLVPCLGDNSLFMELQRLIRDSWWWFCSRTLFVQAELTISMAEVVKVVQVVVAIIGVSSFHGRVSVGNEQNCVDSNMNLPFNSMSTGTATDADLSPDTPHRHHRHQQPPITPAKSK